MEKMRALCIICVMITFHQVSSVVSFDKEQCQNMNENTSALLDNSPNVSSEHIKDKEVSVDVEVLTLLERNKESIVANYLKLEAIEFFDEYYYKDVDAHSWIHARSLTENMLNNSNNTDDYEEFPSSASVSSDRPVSYRENLDKLLTRISETLQNGSAENNYTDSKDLNPNFDDEDPCEKWLKNKDKFDKAFLGPHTKLPACPCEYPINIFYDDEIWDNEQQKNFRWRDASGDSYQLDIYKPGAIYCVRSMFMQRGDTTAEQHCCYDSNRRLLTRGSGAGTYYYVSSDISKELHEKIDKLPWLLCNGDFSRYNAGRPPNNDNGCEINPDDEEYERQLNKIKHY